MLRDNSTLRRESRKKLRIRWQKPVMLVLISIVIELAVNTLQFFISVFINLPLSYGRCIAFLKLSRDEKYSYDDLFLGFRNYVNVLTTYLLVWIYRVLWTLLLIVPGVIKSYSYAMTPYLLYDRGLTNNEAIEESMRMMEGHKMRLFTLDIVYFALVIALLITIIGWVWVLPHWYLARANFYTDLIAEEQNRTQTTM